MMLHHRDNHLIPCRQALVRKTGSDQVDRLSRAAGKDDLISRACIKETTDLITGRLMRLRRRLAQEMNTAMDVRVHVIITTLDFLDNHTGFLGCRAVVKIDQRFIVIDLMAQDREILPNGLDIKFFHPQKIK